MRFGNFLGLSFPSSNVILYLYLCAKPCLDKKKTRLPFEPKKLALCEKFASVGHHIPSDNKTSASSSVKFPSKEWMCVILKKIHDILQQ